MYSKPKFNSTSGNLSVAFCKVCTKILVVKKRKRRISLYFIKEMKLHILHPALVLNFLQDVSSIRKCLFCDITFERQHLHNL